MSILYENPLGTLISHENYINSTLVGLEKRIQAKSEIFQINYPYKKRKSLKAATEPILSDNIVLEYSAIDKQYFEFLRELKNAGFLTQTCSEHFLKNTSALEEAEKIYNESNKYATTDYFGANLGPPTVKPFGSSSYIFPQNCQFYYPPWWNKYIRRKRKKTPHAYNMMYDCDLKQLALEDLLTDDGIIVVWCTNSPQHLNYLINEIFVKWKVRLVAKWFWIKVTINGEPICDFSRPPGKQPFEQILIAKKGGENELIPTDGKLIVSIPSAIHSHKPPLIEVLKPFLPDNPSCLEVFARYLLPNWTSYGNEVLKFQHESFYLINNN
ncbi:hypothetical protein ABEB36_006735 [Hypothenemus hampei]|uniref:Methyltransferase-like protein 4 n=1 Tax=Hypothenemus hampei TaxID=57062 RepID=A0ABD1EVI0_HYPHA